MFCFISPGAQGTPGSPGHPGVPGAAGNISDSNCSSTFTLNKVMLSRCRLSSRLQQYCGSQSKTRTAIRNWQLNIQTIDRHLKTLTLELGIGRCRWNLECRHNSTCLTMWPLFTNYVLLCVITFWVACSDVRYDCRMKTMFGSCLAPVVCMSARVLFTLFVFVCT